MRLSQVTMALSGAVSVHLRETHTILCQILTVQHMSCLSRWGAIAYLDNGIHFTINLNLFFQAFWKNITWLNIDIEVRICAQGALCVVAIPSCIILFKLACETDAKANMTDREFCGLTCYP